MSQLYTINYIWIDSSVGQLASVHVHVKNNFFFDKYQKLYKNKYYDI